METTCARARKAMVDGEPTAELDAHTAGCAECADFAAIAALFRAATTDRPPVDTGTTSLGAPATAATDQASAEPVTTDLASAGSTTDPYAPTAFASTELAATRPVDRRTAGGLSPGQRLLHYTLVETLGRGGQGAVFKATEHEIPGSVVALKIVRSSPASLKEVRAKPITHPNVVRINHTAVYGELRLVEMEYVDGGTLADRLAPAQKHGGRPALSRAEATSVFRGVLEGMKAVHAAGILHLDLKPLNILLRRDLQPVVTDFGMSVGAGSKVLGGTRGWTAPEVDRGEEPDVRADVYSLGAILEALIPAPGPALADVITRAEATRRDQRYPDVESLRVAFEEALKRDADVARPPEPAPAPVTSPKPVAPTPPALPPEPAAPTPARAEAVEPPRSRRSLLWLGAAVLAAGTAALLWMRAPQEAPPGEPAPGAPPPTLAPAEPPAPPPALSASTASPRPSARKPPAPPRPAAPPTPSISADPPKLKYPGVL